MECRGLPLPGGRVPRSSRRTAAPGRAPDRSYRATRASASATIAGISDGLRHVRPVMPRHLLDHRVETHARRIERGAVIGRPEVVQDSVALVRRLRRRRAERELLLGSRLRCRSALQISQSMPAKRSTKNGAARSQREVMRLEPGDVTASAHRSGGAGSAGTRASCECRAARCGRNRRGARRPGRRDWTGARARPAPFARARHRAARSGRSRDGRSRRAAVRRRRAAR